MSTVMRPHKRFAQLDPSWPGSVLGAHESMHKLRINRGTCDVGARKNPIMRRSSVSSDRQALLWPSPS